MISRKQLLRVFRIGVSFFIILAFLKFIPYNQVLKVYALSNPWYLLLALGMYCVIHLGGILRLKVILRSCGIAVSFREAFYINLSSFFFTLFAPSVIGADVFRTACINARRKNMAAALVSIVIDRMSGMTGLAMLALIALLTGYRYVNDLAPVKFMFLFLLLFNIGALAIMSKSFFSYIHHFSGKWIFKGRFEKLFHEISLVQQNFKIFLKAVGISVAIHSISSYVFFLIGRSFSLHVPFSYYFMFIPVSMFLSGIPVTIAGIGTREAGVIFFLTRIGVPSDTALAVSLVFLSYMMLLCCMGGILYVTVYHRWLESCT